RSTWFFFFFSSRRRHTRLQGDWSSDVCSSDLSGSALKHSRCSYYDTGSTGDYFVSIARVRDWMEVFRLEGVQILMENLFFDVSYKIFGKCCVYRRRLVYHPFNIDG